MTGRSNALRWPVQAPRGRVYLSSLQWSLWWILTRPRKTWTHGDITLTKLSTLTGSSRGRCWHAMSRLRSLELVSFRAYPVMAYDPERRPRRFSPGRNGRLLVWTPAAARRGRLTLPARSGANDSVSGPFGTYLAREGLEAAWRRRKSGAGAARRRPTASPWSRDGGDNGPRPRRGPPHVLYARCPTGHVLRVGRHSWLEGPTWAPSLDARFEGRCPRCSADVVESIRLEFPPPPPRGLSAAELADPALLDRRIDSARRELAAGGLHPAVREVLRRDYAERPPGYTGRYPDPPMARAGHVLAVLDDATLRPEPAGPLGEGPASRPATDLEQR